MRRLLLLLLSLTGPAFAQAHLEARPTAATLEIAPGGSARLHLRLRVAPGWHTFPGTPQTSPEGVGPTPLTVVLPPECGLHAEGPLHVTPEKRHWDAGFRMEVTYVEGEAEADLTLRAEPNLALGDHHLPLTLSYQVCREGGCRPPDRVEVSAPLHVRPGPGTALGRLLLLALLAGFGALLTPCVFPMVPVTISFFLQRAARDGHRPWRDALLYGAGIILAFCGAGLLAAALFGAGSVQAFATSPFLNAALAALFVLFALNLFGALELGLPQVLLQRLGTQRRASGTWSVVTMGLTFALTSFTCTVPFVGSTLVSAAQGRWFHPLVAMLGFSVAFALPFVLLALFPAALTRLPKGGGWMARFKAVLGFIELAAAVKFLSNADLAGSWHLLSRDLFLAAWMACAGLACLYLLGLFRLPSEESGPVGAGRLLAAAAFAALTFRLGSGLLGRPLGEWEAFLPPAPVAALSASTSDDPSWMEDLIAAQARARQEGKPLLIDFTGVTCTNCRWMERNMFPRPAIAQALDRFVRVRLYTDRPVETDLRHRRLQQERFGTVELPLYAVLGPEGQVLGTQAFTRDEAAFSAFLAAVP